MTVILELENPEKWQTRDSQFFSTTPQSELPEYVSGVTFASNVIALLVDNAEARSTWNFAGWAAQKINVPVGPNSFLQNLIIGDSGCARNNF
jgi:hypothetical protein